MKVWLAHAAYNVKIQDDVTNQAAVMVQLTSNKHISSLTHATYVCDTDSKTEVVDNGAKCNGTMSLLYQYRFDSAA